MKNLRIIITVCSGKGGSAKIEAGKFTIGISSMHKVRILIWQRLGIIHLTSIKVLVVYYPPLISHPLI